MAKQNIYDNDTFFDNFKNLLNTNFPKWYLNTFIIALVVSVVQTIIVLCMSYTLSRFRFKMRKGLMQFMLSTASRPRRKPPARAKSTSTTCAPSSRRTSSSR